MNPGLSLPETQRPPARGGEEAADCLDVLGIGFGPSNLSLAIAIEEHPAASRPSSCFLEAKPRFGWHDGMLLPGASMQISFLKDLVTPRTPTSPYGFLAYLHEHGRLTDFINLKTFFPSRQEFHGYLSWAAQRVQVPVRYGTRAQRIDWLGDRFEVIARHLGRDGREREERFTARRIVLAPGLRPVLPEGIESGTRVFHNHELIPRLERLGPLRHGRFVVIGSGQSAAEVAAHLLDAYPDAEVHAAFRRFGYTPSDDTPYANRIFDPDAVDAFHRAPAAVKRGLLDAHRLTNYSAVDAELIQELFRREYDERVTGTRRFFVHRASELAQLRQEEDGVTAELRGLVDGEAESLRADAVVFATGFRASDVRELLGDGIERDGAFHEGPADDEVTGAGLPLVERDYSLRLSGLPRRIFLNGGVQHSHGLSSSLLSNIAVRSGEILDAIELAADTPAS